MKRGFSLAETILAGFILSLVMMSLFNIIPTAALTAKRAEMNLLAQTIAQATVEEYRAKTFSALDETAGVQILEPVKSRNVTFRRSLLILPGSTVGASPLLKRIGVLVTWDFREQSFQAFQESWVCDIEAY